MLFHLLRLENVPIFQQLKLEEALLRADTRNWCILNHGSPPSIVMGISGKPAELINTPAWEKNPVPIIKRFSGGGCVAVDSSTSFVSIICNVEDNAPQSFPQDVARWNADIYNSFLKHLDFRLLENDYVLGEKKFGGNAQYLTKNRWLHHSTLLWDYHLELMALLKIPAKQPKYRDHRPHSDFLCRLNEHFSSQREINDLLISHLKKNHSVVEMEEKEAWKVCQLPHRQSTEIIWNDALKP
jgi:lipoate---protein ligase